MNAGECGDGRELVIDIKVEGEEGMYVTTEWFGRDGWMAHNCRVECEQGATVESVVDELCQSELWSPSELAYGVIIADDGVSDSEWPVNAPRELRWVGQAWRAGMTMEALFAGVELKEHERYFLVISKLDVKTQHVGPMPVEEDTRLGVQNAVWWLRSLYRDVNGMLRELKAQA